MHNDGVTVSTFQFLKRFNSEDTARKYIEKLRWNGKPKCPNCASVTRIQARSRKAYYRCLACVVDFTVRTGTVMERSHVPLDISPVATSISSTCGRVKLPHPWQRDGGTLFGRIAFGNLNR